MQAALAVLIDEGAGAFTIRRIATACGVKVGNVSYHFPRKEMLIQVLLDEIVESYDKLLDDTVRKPGLSAEERLRLIIILCLDDIASKRTSHLFTELWALANRNAFVAGRVRVFCQKVHDLIGLYVAELNPALSAENVHTVALYISASMEGATPFVGYRKPWAHKFATWATTTEVENRSSAIMCRADARMAVIAPAARDETLPFSAGVQTAGRLELPLGFRKSMPGIFPLPAAPTGPLETRHGNRAEQLS